MTEHKPDFLHWAHRELWGILADNPEWNKGRAILLLQRRYPNRIKYTPPNICFACDALLRRYTVKWMPCRICCPIDWGVGRSCLDDNTVFSLWQEAYDLKKWDLATKYAIQIKNLPLKNNAHEHYNIKESCND